MLRNYGMIEQKFVMYSVTMLVGILIYNSSLSSKLLFRSFFQGALVILHSLFLQEAQELVIE